MTSGGEAVEAGLQAFVEALARRAELQSVALDDIRARLISLEQLMRESPPDAAKVHGALRDLVHVFEDLSNNAEAFMAGLARTIELQRAEVAAVMSFKTRLIDYLQRFIGDLVTRSSQIAELLIHLRPLERALLQIAAERDARNAAPGDVAMDAEAVDTRLIAWNERWAGLMRWFVSVRSCAAKIWTPSSCRAGRGTAASGARKRIPCAASRKRPLRANERGLH